MAPRISPNKTWSGAIAGLACAAAVGALMGWLTGAAAIALLVGLSVALSLVAQAGDLVESAVKRHYGVKDSGNLIPGHGGILDRVDGLLLAAPVIAAVALLNGGSAFLWRHPRKSPRRKDAASPSLGPLARAVAARGGVAWWLGGGVGVGYTAGATVVRRRAGGRVVVAEIMQEVVEWNRGPLGPLAENPLDDRRTELVLGDVAAVIRSSESRFDAILLDVDNSVNSFSLPGNGWLYTSEGLAAAHRALRPGGALAIWSVGTDAKFGSMLRRHGFTAVTHPVRDRNKRGGHFSVLVGRRS